jgi:hypothetical protein
VDTVSNSEVEVRKDITICPSYAPDGTDKIDTSGDPNSVFVSAPSGYLIDFYCVKAGTDTVIVYLDTPQPSLELTAPNGKDVSHFSVHWIPESCEEGEWCSPGFWRNQPGQWPEGYHGTFYNDYTYAYPPATIASNPTLDEVLASPSTYGGAAFNNVADLLSDAAGLDFDMGDDRIHSCPLSADEANP